MADDEFTCDLFRFLQLLCEGHNNGENDINSNIKTKWQITKAVRFNKGFSCIVSIVRQIFRTTCVHRQGAQVPSTSLSVQ